MNLSRQRSTCFLLDPPQVRGSDFVEMLRLIGYPGALDLKGEDFDWLCEGNEDLEAFLGWLCNIVDQRNALTADQLEAYNALLDSGQHLLEVEELQNLCKEVNETEEDCDPEDTRSLEELEAELQSLRALRAHRLQSRNKLESLGLTLLHNRLSSKKLQRQEEKILTHTKEELSTLNSRCNAALLKLRETTTELGTYHSVQSFPNIFLSSTDLDSYIKLEDMCWEQVEENAKTMLPVKEEDLENERRARLEMEKESERVRTAWASQAMQLNMALVTLNGNKEALNWLNRITGEQIWDPMRLTLLEREIQSLEAEVEALQTQRLPGLVCKTSVGLCLPAHHGWVEMEKQKLTWIDQVQAPVAESILSQLSRLQLVELGLQREMCEHRQTERDLRALVIKMSNQLGELGRRTMGPRDLRATPLWLKPLRVDSKDQTGVRLSVMLEKSSRQKELFPKYEALQHQAMALVQELTSLRSIHHGPLPQTTHLEHDCEELHHCLCRGTRNLQPRDPTLSLAFDALSSSVSLFNQWCLDCLRDLERKKVAIQTTYLEQGRQLYILFYQNPNLLAKQLQDLECRVAELLSD